MATNRAERLDPALDRRVLFHLKFEAPGKAEREAIWRLHLPEAVKGAAAVDCARLARHRLSGGGIKNASWRAILRAAREGVEVTTEVVEDEARRETRRGSSERHPAGFGTLGKRQLGGLGGRRLAST
jgi:SpoVK/Ycf46/Vps4 family AAA+-type ATPase